MGFRSSLGVSLPQEMTAPEGTVLHTPLNRLTLPGLLATADCSYACEARASETVMSSGVDATGDYSAVIDRTAPLVGPSYRG